MLLLFSGCTRFLPEKERAPFEEEDAGADMAPGPSSVDQEQDEETTSGRKPQDDAGTYRNEAEDRTAADAETAAEPDIVEDGREAPQPDAVSGDPEAQDPARTDAFPQVPAAVQKPEVSPELGPPEAARPRAVSETKVVIKTVIGLIVLLVLAYLAGNPRVRKVEEFLGISQVITAGFPFVALGVISSLPGVDILTGSMLDNMTPFLEIGLGWVGLCAGYRFDLRGLDSMPRGTAFITAMVTFFSFATVVVVCGLLLLLFGQSWRDATFLRDAAALGAAGALTAPTAARILLERGAPPEAAGVIKNVSLLDVIAGLLGLMFLGAFFRPRGAELGWQLPGTAWIFVTLGLGATIGIVVYVVLRRPAKGSESIALLLGSVSFAAGMAGFLFLSPIVVCFVAGVILANLPGDYKTRVGKVLEQLERPVYLVFLVVVGALWNFSDWRGWVLLPVFVWARFAGRFLGTLLIRKRRAGQLVKGSGTPLVAAPLGELSIAIVVSVQALYRGRAIPWIVTAVIGGAIITEILVQLVLRIRFRKGRRDGSILPEMK